VNEIGGESGNFEEETWAPGSWLENLKDETACKIKKAYMGG
jgi:hypothetical protein